MADHSHDPLMDALVRARPDAPAVDPADAEALRARLGARHPVLSARVALRAAAALILVAGVATGVVLASRPSHAPTLAMADVADQTSRAMTTAYADMLETVSTTETDASGTTLSTADVWGYDGQRRVETFDASGSPILDVGLSYVGDTRTTTLVNYPTQKYVERQVTLPGVPSALGEVDPAQQIRQELADGVLTVVGPTQLNGASTIELESAAPQGTQTPAIAHVDFGLATGGVAPALMATKLLLLDRFPVALALGSIRIWVDPVTYLPVQRTLTTTDGLTLTSTFTWTSPTASSLANLTVPIPSGFTPLPASEPATTP